ncbi:unnamed protein product [Allacma fusca]|uniref:Uncharacterized protein n=1 Tax=Allacma fusca TaxID=39272 RepID=A0A8J2KDK0_9HEXA|nr:unnamed protein product [Allacma fusca]
MCTTATELAGTGGEKCMWHICKIHCKNIVQYTFKTYTVGIFSTTNLNSSSWISTNRFLVELSLELFLTGLTVVNIKLDSSLRRFKKPANKKPPFRYWLLTMKMAIILFLVFVPFGNLAPIHPPNENPVNGNPPPKRKKYDGPRCQLKFSEVKLDWSLEMKLKGDFQS